METLTGIFDMEKSIQKGLKLMGKYIGQAVSVLTAFVIFMLAKHSATGDIELADVNMVLKKLEMVSFFFVGITSLFGYAYLVGRDIANDKRICHTLAQYICILNFLNSFAYVYIINQWVDVIGVSTLLCDSVTVDILYSMVDVSVAINMFLTIQFIFVVLFQRWILPINIKFQMKRPLGKILKDEKYISDDQLQDALAIQRKEAQGDDKK